MNNFSTFVGIVASLCGIVGFIVAVMNSKKIGKMGIAIISTILIAVIGAGVFFSTSTTIVPHPPSNPFVSNATEPPTTTPSPVPTPQVIHINQTMTCTDCSPNGYNFSLIVRDATIDPVKQQVTLLVGVQNNTADTFSPYINFLKLQDTQTGVTTSGQGDGFSNFQITANQLILFRPTFQFVPVAGHLYSLSGNLSSEFDLSPITIKF